MSDDVDGFDRWLDEASEGLDQNLAETVDVERSLARVKAEGDRRLADPERQYRRAIAEGDPRGYLDLGEYFLRLEEVEAAEPLLLRALALRLDDALIPVGILMEMRGRLTEAVWYYELAIQREVEDAVEVLDAARRRRSGRNGSGLDRPTIRRGTLSDAQVRLLQIHGGGAPPGRGGLVGRPAAGPFPVLPAHPDRFPGPRVQPPPRPVTRPIYPPARPTQQ